MVCTWGGGHGGTVRASLKGDRSISQTQSVNKTNQSIELGSCVSDCGNRPLTFLQLAQLPPCRATMTVCTVVRSSCSSQGKVGRYTTVLLGRVRNASLGLG